VRELSGSSAGGWHRALVGAAVELADSQPAMASLLALGTRAILVSRKAEGDGASTDEQRDRVLESIGAWTSDWREAGQEIVRRAQESLPPSGWVATYTRSSLVERALLAAHEAGASLRVLCAESRPMNEGRALAAVLARAEIPAWLVADGSLGLLLPQAGAMWIGVDAVREKTFVSKAGTYALLLVARELNVPVYALAQRAKFVPDRCRRLTLPRRDASEVWEDAPPGVNVVNLPFEEVPLPLLRGIIAEGGFLTGREITDAAGSALVAEELLEPAKPKG
jgi:translation initiation factor 2B subunit (eIF-2B alpha/beta/delta family)